jgi:outer membrane receptor protein involved in Fe transport
MHDFPKVRATAFVFLFVLLALAFSTSAFAQATKGTLRGTVTDPNGHVVAGATVTATNQSTGVKTGTYTTNNEGIYVIPDLLPGQYTVTVEPISGFSRKVVKDVDVQIGQDTSVPIVLAIGAANETVTVTAQGEELLQRDQSQISSTFETRKISDLPSNGAGGGLDTLALLSPGVIPARASGVNTNGAALSVNGNRARSVNFQIDGSDNNDLSIGGPSLFVDNQDQIQEYQIITNNFSAQYGRNQGAVVNIVTKGGGNQFHGSAFEFHQDNKHLNSLNNTEKRGGQTAPNPSIYNVFGGTFGGPFPIFHFGEGGPGFTSGRDRVFFFGSYQGIRNPATFTLRNGGLSFMPSAFPSLLADFPNNALVQTITKFSPFAIGNARPRTDLTGTVQTVYVDPNTNKILSAPAPGAVGPFLFGGPYDIIALNGTLPNGQTLKGKYYQAAFPELDVSEPFTENEYSFRFDIKATERDNITVRYLYQKQLTVNSLATSNGFTGDVPATSKNFGGTYTRQISTSMVNEFRATYQNLSVLFGGASNPGNLVPIPSPTAIDTAFTNITFGGGFALGRSTALSAIGPATNLPQGRIVKVYQAADNLTYTRGRHTFIFGAEYKHLPNQVPFLPLINGAFTYSSVNRFINNAPSAISITAGNPITNYSESDQYYFVQDDFKIRPNLTLNLGVRYEYTGQPINVLHDITVARESNASTAFYDPSLPLSVRTVPYIKPDKNNFAPRVGFAYTPRFFKSVFGEDATVIRGGFGIAYDPAFYNILLNVQNTAPYAAAVAFSTANILASDKTSPFPLPFGTPTGTLIRSAATNAGILPLGKLDPRYLTQTIVAPDFHAPYSEQWSFGVQRQINRNNVAEVRYVGTHGVGLFQSINGNFVVAPLYNGFSTTRNVTINNVPTPISYTFPSFKQFVPSNVTPLVCKDDPNTPFVNESLCNGRILPQAALTIRQNSAQSIYHSMQARYNGRFLNNSLLLGASYTWSKTIDNASEIFAFGGGDALSVNAQNPFCINSCERSLSALDRPHAFSMNYIYDVPLFKDQRGVIGHLLGGWQLNGTYLLTSGAPYTPGQTVNTSGSYNLNTAYLTAADRPFVTNPNADPRLVGISSIDAFFALGKFVADATGKPILSPTTFYSLNQLNANSTFVTISPNDVHFIVNGPGAAQYFGTPFGTSARNSLRGPKYNQLNMGVFKNTKVGERINVQFRAEAFNVLNHPTPGYGVVQSGYLPVIDVLQAGVSGAAFAENTDITLARRVIQFGLRLTF